LHTEEEKLLAKNLQGPSHLLLPSHLRQTLLLVQLGLPLLNMLARWRMLQRKVLDHQIAPLEVPRRLVSVEQQSRWTQERRRPRNGRRNQRLFFALTICKKRLATKCHLRWQRLFREPVLLRRYVLPVDPERHGGFINNLLWGFKSDFC
jgi:hypothetical protein